MKPTRKFACNILYHEWCISIMVFRFRCIWIHLLVCVVQFNRMFNYIMQGKMRNMEDPDPKDGSAKLHVATNNGIPKGPHPCCHWHSIALRCTGHIFVDTSATIHDQVQSIKKIKTEYVGMIFHPSISSHSSPDKFNMGLYRLPSCLDEHLVLQTLSYSPCGPSMRY